MTSRTVAVMQDVVNTCILPAFYVFQHMTTDIVCLYGHTLILGFIDKDPSFLPPELICSPLPFPRALHPKENLKLLVFNKMWLNQLLLGS